MKIFLPTVLTCLAMTARAGQAAPTAQKAVEQLVASALEAIKLPKKQILKGAGTVRGCCDLVQNDFDVEGISRALLPAGIWDKATATQQKDYVLAVTGHMANFAGFTLLQTAGKTLNMEYKELAPSDGTFVVQVKDPVNQVDGLIFLKAGADGAFRVEDLSFGGVSMLGVKRADFRRTAEKGITVITQALNAMSSTRMLGGTCAEARVESVALKSLIEGAGLDREMDMDWEVDLEHEIESMSGAGGPYPVPPGRAGL